MTNQLQELAEIQSLMLKRGGPIAVAAALGMDRRTMQRVHAGQRHCSPTLRRRIAELPEIDHG